ncbi:VanZ family protein [Campylobacter geochelonis]|uniref:VanZ like family n=1 Tax=Campylobacter geochelonis TaxID=1780362 RepID=A0A128EK45_9BACT|nr:VanZ family protein [Campylobacter geochelonis]QKF71614.1 VanZ family membrane protein [Campylobacter geochelonis]CZE48718.1 VanZ like family [Campylobacter geochelonis]
MKFSVKTGLNLAFLLYLAALLRLAVFRDSFSTSNLFEVGSYNLSLFSDLIEIYKNDKFIFILLFLGNLGWFVPFGAFLKYHGVSFLKCLFYGFCFSLLVETSQFVFKCGVFELDDLVLNCVGVLLGARFVMWLKAHKFKKIQKELI